MQILRINFKRDFSLLSEVPFFICITILSSYAVQGSYSVLVVSFFICCFSTLSALWSSIKASSSYLAAVICIVGFFIGLNNYSSLVLISTVFYFWLSQKSKLSTKLWQLSCLYPIILLSFNILGYWGLPGTVFIIWFWGLPVAILLWIFLYFTNKVDRLFPYFLISFGILLSLNQTGLILNNFECSSIKSKNSGDSVNSKINTLKNVCSDFSLVSLSKAQQDIAEKDERKKWIISLADTPALNSEWLFKNAKSGNYYLFAEHDNLNSFIGTESPFNIDSFRRKSPWNIYKPVMSKTLFDASEHDLSYCSNIGCTIKSDVGSYPLVWSYDSFGSPIILAKGEIIKQRRFTYVGDSDPIVSFLSAYNPNWIMALLGRPNFLDFFISFLFFAFGMFMLVAKRKNTHLILMVLFLVLSVISSLLSSDVKPEVDISIKSTGKWLSPHYENHFSSLPKNLVQQGYTVSIERKVKHTQVELFIIDKNDYKRINENNTLNKTIILLMENAALKTAVGQFISSGNIPLGEKNINIFGYKIIVGDVRALELNGESIGVAYQISENVFAIGTDSPQKIQIIKDKPSE